MPLANRKVELTDGLLLLLLLHSEIREYMSNLGKALAVIKDPM